MVSSDAVCAKGSCPLIINPWKLAPIASRETNEATPSFQVILRLAARGFTCRIVYACFVLGVGCQETSRLPRTHRTTAQKPAALSKMPARGARVSTRPTSAQRRLRDMYRTLEMLYHDPMKIELSQRKPTTSNQHMIGKGSGTKPFPTITNPVWKSKSSTKIAPVGSPNSNVRIR